MLALGILAAPPAAEAQQTHKIPVLGILRVPPIAGNTSLGILKEGLRDFGYIEDQTIVLEVRSAEGQPEALPRLAADLVQRQVDVLFASGPAAVQAASKATSRTPIVALDLETDPVQSGLARSLGRPGGNITGLFLDLPGITGKWLELLREAAPKIRHVGLLWDSTTGPWQLASAKTVAQQLGIQLQVLEVQGIQDLDGALTAATRVGNRGLVQLSSPLFSTSFKRIAEFTIKNRLPAISPFRRFAEAGGLMAYGPNEAEFYRRAAGYVDKILKGAKPGDLPIEQPKTFELVVNLKTAKELGLTIPQSILVWADEVIR